MDHLTITEVNPRPKKGTYPSWEDFKRSISTGIPALYALRSDGEILVARRGGVWYTPRGVEAEAAEKALGGTPTGETVDITPAGMTSPEGCKRVQEAQAEWDSAAHAVANALNEAMYGYVYGEGFTADEVHQLKALLGARDRKQEAFLRAVAGK